jgi:phospholipase C
MNRLDEGDKTWRIYAPLFDEVSYGWSICPTFADCLYTQQSTNHVTNDQFIPDAQAGQLPNFSIVKPHWTESQHNGNSMLHGDNWIAEQVEAVMNGPNWESTAIFVTYDDCGCFYDHVPPPPLAGIRVPMVIVSPYAKPAFTDSNDATFASMQAFVERTFGLAPMSTRDAVAYDFWDSFDFHQEPLPPIPLPQHEVPRASIEWMRTHPVEDEFT